ncbi:MAG: hypothetical protein K2K19_03800, partial [Acetatifactor sp.]|nr:hypothetical protein [Acetatifactor sp.]
MRKRRFVLFIMTIVLLLTACGGPGDEDMEAQESVSVQEETRAQGESAVEEAPPQDSRQERTQEALDGQESDEFEEAQQRPGYDWRTEDWKLDEKGDWGHELYAAEYIYGLASDPEEEYVDRSSIHCILGNRIYSIDEYSISEEEDAGQFYYLNCYDSLTGEIWHRSLELPSPPELEQYGDCNVYYLTFDVQSEQELVIFLHVRAKGEGQDTLAYLAVHMSMEGELLSVLDLYPALVAGGAQDCTCGSYWHSPGQVYVDLDGIKKIKPIRWEERDSGLSGQL